MKIVKNIAKFVARQLNLNVARRRAQARALGMEGLEPRVVLDATAADAMMTQMMAAWASTPATPSTTQAPTASTTQMGPTQSNVTTTTTTAMQAPQMMQAPMTGMPGMPVIPNNTATAVTLAVTVNFQTNGSQVITASVSGLTPGANYSLSLDGSFAGNSMQITGDGSYQFNFNPAIYGIGSAEVTNSNGTVLALQAFYAF